jgi:arsenate reductase
MSKELRAYIETVEAECAQLSVERKQLLEPLVDYLDLALAEHGSASVNAVCSANSRRSQLAQVWAHVAARHYGLANVQSHSSGTEATACNPRTVAALERAGLDVSSAGPADNPHYQLRMAENTLPIELWSKRIDDNTLPRTHFAALLCCDEADQACPQIPGAKLRVALHYSDPKLADDTDHEQATYDERCRQIAGEMFWVMSRVAKKQQLRNAAR